VTAAVTIILGDNTCELDDAAATTLAEQLRLRYRNGAAPGHHVADVLELVLVGERVPVVPLDDLEAVAIAALIDQPFQPEAAGITALRSVIRRHLGDE
jgi:hypothetical protein